MYYKIEKEVSRNLDQYISKNKSCFVCKQRSRELEFRAEEIDRTNNTEYIGIFHHMVYNISEISNCYHRKLYISVHLLFKHVIHNEVISL